MSYAALVSIHLTTVLIAALIGGYLLIASKGDAAHRLLGKMFMMLMLLTAVVTLFMPSAFEPRVLKHFGIIHILSIYVLFTVCNGYIAAQIGNIVRHGKIMKSLFFGGIIVAGVIAFAPGRMLHKLFF